MDTLKTAISVVELIVVAAIVLLIGDYIGYKFGRMKLATYTLFTVLGVIILFAIYAAIKLNMG